jgi:hypothetical protein
MGKAVFVDKSAAFFRKNESMKNMVMAHMAMDIEISIKTDGITPVKTGDLKAEVRHFKSRNNQYRVEADKQYAAVQELGERQGHTFKNYTTGGTGKGWFKHAIESVTRNRDNYISEAARALNL